MILNAESVSTSAYFISLTHEMTLFEPQDLGRPEMFKQNLVTADLVTQKASRNLDLPISAYIPSFSVMKKHFLPTMCE